jgi:hypothetical protein
MTAALVLPPGKLARVFAVKARTLPVEAPAPADGPTSGPRPVRLYSDPAEPIEAIVERCRDACLLLAERHDYAVVTYTGRPVANAENALPDWSELAGARGRDRA